MRQTRFVERGGPMYTSGVWIARAGKEADFARKWQESVDRLSLELPGITFRLMRDLDDPSRFVSVTGPWRNREQFEETRSSAAFQESMADVDDVLESYEIRVYQLAVEVS
jgi:heme-degrading monooxygenase HmoA